MEIEKEYYTRISFAKDHGYDVISRVRVYYKDEELHKIIAGGQPYLLGKYVGGNMNLALATKDELVTKVTIYPQPEAIYPENIDGCVWVNAEYAKDIFDSSGPLVRRWKRKYYFALPKPEDTSDNYAKSDDTKETHRKRSVEETGKKGFSKTDKIIAFCIIGFFLSLVIWAVWSKSKKESQQERIYQTERVIETSDNADNIAEQITKQLDQLTETINALPEPNEINAARCGDKVKVLQWEVIDIPEDNPNAERLKKSQRRAVETFVNAKNRYIKKLEKYDEYAGVYYDEVEGYLLDEK